MMSLTKSKELRLIIMTQEVYELISAAVLLLEKSTDTKTDTSKSSVPATKPKAP